MSRRTCLCHNPSKEGFRNSRAATNKITAIRREFSRIDLIKQPPSIQSPSFPLTNTNKKNRPRRAATKARAVRPRGLVSRRTEYLRSLFPPCVFRFPIAKAPFLPLGEPAKSSKNKLPRLGAGLGCQQPPSCLFVVMEVRY